MASHSHRLLRRIPVVVHEWSQTEDGDIDGVLVAGVAKPSTDGTANCRKLPIGAAGFFLKERHRLQSYRKGPLVESTIHET
jgi:hypothetical protein